MTLFLQQFVNGIALGSVYSLVALGLTLVYGVLKVPNFAHGALYMAGAYVSYVMLTSFGASYIVAMAVSVVVLAVLGGSMEWLVFRRLEGKTPVHSMIAALGLLFFMEGTADVIWGPTFRQVPTPFDGVVTLLGVNITEQRILVIVAAVVTMVGLYLLLKRTLVGMSIEAMAQDREGALLVGIDTRRVALLTFAISGALAAVAGSLIAPLLLVFPNMGELIILKAFVIVILGGMGSVPGAILGGYLLALAETMAGTYVSFAFSELIAFGLLVLVLVIRPTGLFQKGV
ncbi:MAG: branched-chain amino acid ABC transporter permease [Gemmatimonadetes bacterium]|nr:branched-chain amino acid ABC transporter permease [Gemmatimonadota bacterium]MEE2846734.1 branched-chain amino acid ABC transporter permease [Gemmatimonadota bacterium]HBD97135.1 branched-chain amino acid ABC transporter permease [Gemmatimonadota bacterium]HIC54857.1 branched-chain amino acid ABC transporter permease [Gemmatimonadota bacterium]HIN51268.1 branched-chain amino acid ABC transporter permease [Gemmatimonadota bacterium]